MLLGIGLKDVADCSLPEFHELLMRHPVENIEFVVPKHLEGCGGMMLLKDLRASELEGCTGVIRFYRCILVQGPTAS